MTRPAHCSPRLLSRQWCGRSDPARRAMRGRRCEPDDGSRAAEPESRRSIHSSVARGAGVRRAVSAAGGGAVLVDTDETTGVYETALAPKLYVDRSLVQMNLLAPSPTTTYCPYKGTASYWNVVVDAAVIEDAAWSYEDPLPESLPIRGLLS